MAKRDLQTLADLVEDIVDKDRADTTFDTFVQNMLVLTLQDIIAKVPHARWLLEEHSITLVADQQYVTLPSDVDIDGIVSMRDDSNNRKVSRISATEADMIDPGRDLGGPVLLWWFQRIAGADRIYFVPTPDATDSLTLISGEIITDPSAAQTSALPAKYEWVQMAGAISKIATRLGPSVDGRFYDDQYKEGLAVILRDANSAPGESDVMASHRPRTSAGTHGASFPANFDVSP